MSLQSLNILETKDSYRSPFSRWNESVWILRQPIGEPQISGFPLLPDFVPVSNAVQLRAKESCDLFSRSAPDNKF